MKTLTLFVGKNSDFQQFRITYLINSGSFIFADCAIFKTELDKWCKTHVNYYPDLGEFLDFVIESDNLTMGFSDNGYTVTKTRLESACIVNYDNGVIIDAVALWSDCNNELIALEGVNEEDAHTVVYSYNETKETLCYSSIWGFSYELKGVK